MLSNEGYDALLAEIKQEFPDFKVLKKSESTLMKVIDKTLKVISFGKMNSFMDDFITTIGNTVYVPEKWDGRSASTKAITMRHERVHMRQSQRVGRVLFSLSYLFFPVPILFAHYRAKFEKEAYEESLKAIHEYYGPKFFTPALKEKIVSHFTSAEYMWMWVNKKSVEYWYDSVVAGITKK